MLDHWTELLEYGPHIPPYGGRIDVIYTDLEKAFDKVPITDLGLLVSSSYQVNEEMSIYGLSLFFQVENKG